MLRLMIFAWMLGLALSGCSWFSPDADYHQERLEEWDSTRQYDPATGKYFHSGDIQAQQDPNFQARSD